MKIFALRDVKAGAFNRPFFSVNSGTACRELREGLAEKGDELVADLELYQIGEYDDATGLIEAYAPIHILNCVDLFADQADGLVHIGDAIPADLAQSNA